MEPQLSAEFFIGFLLLEDFLKNLSGAQKELIFSSHRTQKPCADGIVGYEHYITLAEMREGLCYYWRMPLGSYICFGDMLLDGDEPKQINSRAQSLKELIRADILSRIPNKRILDGALVSLPKELKPVYGNLQSYHFDKEQNLFVKTENEVLAKVG